MFRMALAYGSVAILVATTGCTMCCHPYDQSGPVYANDGCPSSAHARAGSILAESPQSSLPTDNRMQDEPASPSPTPAQSPKPATAQAKKHRPSISYVMSGNRTQEPLLGDARPGDVPGSEKMVSVTDRVVKPSADSAPTVDEPSPEPSKPLPASGWSARRPTGEVWR